MSGHWHPCHTGDIVQTGSSPGGPPWSVDGPAVLFLADPFLGVAVSALDSISAGAFVGSLLGVTVLVATPVLVSGAVAPYALRLAVGDVTQAGTISGRLYAISTVGSLLGTFTSALLFIPLIGTRRTFILFGLLLVVLAVWGMARGRLLAALAAHDHAGAPSAR